MLVAEPQLPSNFCMARLCRPYSALAIKLLGLTSCRSLTSSPMICLLDWKIWRLPKPWSVKVCLLLGSIQSELVTPTQWNGPKISWGLSWEKSPAEFSRNLMFTLRCLKLPVLPLAASSAARSLCCWIVTQDHASQHPFAQSFGKGPLMSHLSWS